IPAFRFRQPIRTSPADLFPPDRPVQQDTLANGAAAEPVMPTLPFRYTGKLVEGPDTTIFLTDARRNLLVQTGDIIAEAWRADDIGQPPIGPTSVPLQTAVSSRTGEGT